jgi:hypothetical protein
MRLGNIANKAKQQIDKRGGMDALKGDADELKDIAKGKGSLKDKAKAAGQALKDPGKTEEPAGEAPTPAAGPPGETPPGSGGPQGS